MFNDSLPITSLGIQTEFALPNHVPTLVRLWCCLWAEYWVSFAWYIHQGRMTYRVVKTHLSSLPLFKKYIPIILNMYGICKKCMNIYDFILMYILTGNKQSLWIKMCCQNGLQTTVITLKSSNGFCRSTRWIKKKVTACLNRWFYHVDFKWGTCHLVCLCGCPFHLSDWPPDLVSFPLSGCLCCHDSHQQTDDKHGQRFLVAHG